MSRITLGDWTFSPPWTERRAYALKVLAIHKRAMCSVIFPSTMFPACVHRTAGRWLEERGLARISDNQADIELTERGRIFITVLDGRNVRA